MFSRIFLLYSCLLTLASHAQVDPYLYDDTALYRKNHVHFIYKHPDINAPDKYVLEIDSKGRKTFYAHFTPFGDTIFAFRYRYDVSGKLIFESDHYESSHAIISFLYNDGLLTAENFYHPESHAESKKSFRYDQNGRLIQKILDNGRSGEDTTLYSYSG